MKQNKKLMTQYVLGFAFNKAKNFVVLILKNKPVWQKGRFNGVGGKIEAAETSIGAMIREFEEETGLETDPLDWQPVGTMKGEDWACHCFMATSDDFMSAETMTDEAIHVLPVEEVINGDYQTISNVPFLIEICRDAHRPKKVLIEY